MIEFLHKSRSRLALALAVASLGASACGPQEPVVNLQVPDAAAAARDARKAMRAEGHRKQVFDARRARFEASGRAATVADVASNQDPPGARDYP